MIYLSRDTGHMIAEGASTMREYDGRFYGALVGQFDTPTLQRAAYEITDVAEASVIVLDTKELAAAELAVWALAHPQTEVNGRTLLTTQWILTRCRQIRRELKRASEDRWWKRRR